MENQMEKVMEKHMEKVKQMNEHKLRNPFKTYDPTQEKLTMYAHDGIGDTTVIYTATEYNKRTIKDTTAQNIMAYYGRATWVGVVNEYLEYGEDAARKWLQTEGRNNLKELNKCIVGTATAIESEKG